MNNTAIWQAKVLAFIHDPAEKALVLLRGKGHEAGTVAELKKLLGEGLATARGEIEPLHQLVKKADQWAAAADRPALPKRRGGRVVFAEDPQIIHPLTGERFPLTPLVDAVPVHAIESISFEHFQSLICTDDDGIDWKKTFLALWRFAPDTPAPDLGVLWDQLPADTRSPDHTIWEHLALTSAFAGALAAGRESGPALLLMSFGPVQGFISCARSVSDLWAGSHLLSRIAWEAMKPICDAYGPDAILFPNLRGVALADLWLQDKLHAWPEAGKPAWMTEQTDANPLFSAALPNRFVALVPAGEAESLAQAIEQKVRQWARRQGEKALHALLEIAELSDVGDAQAQLERQFHGFPEVHWAIVPWRLAGEDRLQDEPLQAALKKLGAAPRYLDEPLDLLVRREILIDRTEFFRPNPGVGYPGLFELLERLHAAAKSARPFPAHLEEGYRCTLCGEREWLTPSRGDSQTGTHIFAPSGRRGETLWKAVAAKKPAVAKEGEHLCGLCALKRMWPKLFTAQARESLPELKTLDRFVLSTHSLAISTSLWRWLEALERGELRTPDSTQKASRAREKLSRLTQNASLEVRPAALPRRLHKCLRQSGLAAEEIHLLKRLPSLVDAAKDDEAKEKILKETEDFLGAKPEAYYALVLMDGDRLGEWLAGQRGRLQLARRFHQTTLEDLKSCGALDRYLATERPSSPARHQALSTALNSFALHLGRIVVEDLFMGKLIYAGGDDLMAMVAVHDLPQLMFALRCAYSGVLPKDQEQKAFWARLGVVDSPLVLRNGFGLLQHAGKKRLLRLMGKDAGASLGAVIAHHQAPLARVLGDLRAAEQKAKNEGGRDAFCITLDKRAGGTSHLLGKWSLDAGWEQSDMGLLLDLRDFVGREVSRRAAYVLADTLPDLPADEQLLVDALRYQFKRQARNDGIQVDDIARRLAAAHTRHNGGAACEGDCRCGDWLQNMLLTAEFLAREGRIEEAHRQNGGKSA